MKKILCLFFPTWTTDLIARRSPFGRDDTPLLLVTQRGGREVVVRTSRHAVGVVPGMDLIKARSLLPGAVALSYEREQEREALTHVARWAFRFSPLVSFDEEGDDIFDTRFLGLHLDMSGSDRLFKGTLRLMSSIHRELSSLGVAARLSIAPSLGAAWALSRCASQNFLFANESTLLSLLAPQPISALRIASEQEVALQELGLETVGQLLSVPRAKLRERFGSPLIHRIEQALGEREEPLRPYLPEKHFRVTYSFPQPVSDRQLLRSGTDLLLDKLLILLGNQQEKLSHLLLEMRSRRDLQTLITLAVPSNDREHLSGIISTRIESLAFDEDVHTLSLTALRTVPIAARRRNGLERDEVVVTAELGALLDRLFDSFGREAVCRLTAVNSHVPERAHRYVPFTIERSSAVDALLTAGERPSLLLIPPQPITAMALLPDNPPFRIRWRQQTYAVLKGSGPERIGEEWWREKAPPRDYFKVQLSSGLWIWIYRTAERWFVHGIWA